MHAPLPESELLAACRALFGAEVEVSREFLNYLQPNGAKTAFRTLAKKTHPDAQRPGAGPSPDLKGEQFRCAVEAYAVMRRYFQQREAGLWREHQGVARESAARSGNEHYHQGGVPQRHLEIGRYLFYRGVIPYRSLIEAITWQRRQRPTIGTLARRWNWLNDQAVRSVLGSTGRAGRFGEKAISLGLLSSFQVKQLLLHQRSLQSKFGQFFVERGYVTARELESMLLEQKAHNKAMAHSAGGFPR